MTRAVPSAPWNRDSRMAQEQDLELKKPFWGVLQIVRSCGSHLVQICVEEYSHTRISDLIKMKNNKIPLQNNQNTT